MAAAAGIGAAGSLVGGILGGKGAKKAAKIQAAAADRATQAQKEMFNKQVELQEPFRQGGITSQNRILDLLGLSQNTGAEGFGKYARDFGMQDFQQDPGYDFRFKEGMKALNNSMAAKGLGMSGPGYKAAVNYGQEAGSQEYQNAFNRYQVNRANQLNPLQSLMGSGQTAANTLTGAAGDFGRAQGENILQGGNARASGYIGSANALNNGISGAINAFASMRNNSQPGMSWSPPGSFGIGTGPISPGYYHNPDYTYG